MGVSDRYDDDKDGDGDDDDNDDVFEDPIVEREIRRTRKLQREERQRQRARRRQQRQQEKEEQQPQEQQQQQPADGGGGDGSTGSGRSDELTRTEASPPAAWPATSSNNERSSSSGLDRDGVGGSAGNTCGSAAVKPEAAKAAAKAAVAQTLRCEGVAELSQVPDLLNDESIAGVVLAATASATVSEETPADGGPGVPEMTITGRRLNREVRKRLCFGVDLRGVVGIR